MRVYVGDATAVSSSVTPTKFQLQQALTLYGPMMVGIYASTSFTLYTSGVYNLCPATTTPSKLNHAVLLYGYDSDGNWLIKN